MPLTSGGQDNARGRGPRSSQLGPALLPGGLIFIAGKAGIGYVLHSEALEGVGGQALAQPICHAYGGAAVVGSTVFVPCNEGLQQLQVAPDGSLTLGWQAVQFPGSPVVGGHTVYSLDRGGTLHALDIETGQARATITVANLTLCNSNSLPRPRVHWDHDRHRGSDWLIGLTCVAPDAVESIAQGSIAPLVVVMPDGDYAPGKDYAAFVLRDLMPHVEQTTRVACDRQGRVIGGISLGGSLALTIALEHPDLFGAVEDTALPLIRRWPAGLRPRRCGACCARCACMWM